MALSWKSGLDNSGVADAIQLTFRIPFLSMGAYEVLLEDEPEVLPPENLMRMELPKGAKVRDVGYGILNFKMRRADLSLYPSDVQGFDLNISQFRGYAEHLGTADEVIVSEVKYGGISGTKCVKNRKIYSQI